jgi:hypothetical protein
VDLERLARGDFEAHLGSTFTVEMPGGASIALALAAAGPAGAGRPGGREPFSLVFAGPRTSLLRQGIHRLAHPAFGTLDLFLVPVGPHGGAMQYEAIFS